jgi:hypothetical protein
VQLSLAIGAQLGEGPHGHTEKRLSATNQRHVLAALRLAQTHHTRPPPATAFVTLVWRLAEFVAPLAVSLGELKVLEEHIND